METVKKLDPQTIEVTNTSTVVTTKTKQALQLELDYWQKNSASLKQAVIDSDAKVADIISKLTLLA